MKPMLPTLTFDVPKGSDWFYEVKYDGFRTLLMWDDTLQMLSRNGNSLLELFPEVAQFLIDHEDVFRPFRPLKLDGELVFLENTYKANFSSIQTRGRMRSESKILEKAKQAPCRLLLFDVLMLAGQDKGSLPYAERKMELKRFCETCQFPLAPDPTHPYLLQYIPEQINFDQLWDKVVLHNGEGIIAKNRINKWEEGKRTTQWLKFKNFKYVNCFVTAYEKSNGYFYVSVYKDKEMIPIGQFLFGISPEEKQALFQIIKNNKSNEDSRFIYVTPAICVELKYLEMYDGQMREPHFSQFRFDLRPQDCTYDHFSNNQKNLPEEIDITHPDKPLWETPAVKKMEFIHYLQEVSPYLLPFLTDRLLTVIRYPHGIFGEAFYQKNCPEYAPDFVATQVHDGINYIVCNNLKTLLWLGNQLAFEYHIPFQTISSNGPTEIVFDLDPPSRDAFPLAIKAALLIKEILDQLRLVGFIKTSGNKGLQIYIPLPDNRYTYDDTRLFTEFVAHYLISKEPDLFTIERLKKNRGNRLYVDYIQHGEGKTIIAPYSSRGTKQATIATPLFWEEVNDQLKMESFHVLNTSKRIKTLGDPFRNYFTIKKEQNFEPILQFLKKS